MGTLTAKVLIIGNVWPESNATAAGVRDWAFVRILREAGFAVHYCSPARENEFTRKLREIGVPARSIPANDPAFDEYVRELRPEFVIYDRFIIEEQFGARVFECSPDSVRILDTVDLHFLRRARETALRAGASLESIARCEIPLSGNDQLRELSAIYRSDLALVISDFETRLLTETLQIPEHQLLHHPIAYPATEARTAPETREGFAVIGNFRHPPNWDAVLWLKREIWPAIRSRLPSAELDVYGAYPSREAMELSLPSEGFRVKGFVPDSIEALGRHRVNLAPLRFGAGIKGKIADGWLAGIPAVTTSVGAEGMRSADGRFGGAVADSAEEIARLACELHESPRLCRELAAIGVETLRSRFDWLDHAERLIERLITLRENLAVVRERNLIGAMLWYHGNRSTQYFSKWIETKNRAGGTGVAISDQS